MLVYHEIDLRAIVCRWKEASVVIERCSSSAVYQVTEEPITCNDSSEWNHGFASPSLRPNLISYNTMRPRHQVTATLERPK